MALSLIPSSSSNAPQFKYDVFLSFRGEDTRYNFTSHLHKALSDKQLEIFIDYNLNRGDEISPSLLEAFEKSQLSIIIFSKTYASSSWCLEELVKILECREQYGQIVIPVFYGIDPSGVRYQTGSFADAFAEHGQQSSHKVQRWKDALKKAANLSGWQSTANKPESVLMEDIVQNVLKRLNDMSSVDTSYLVGIDSKIAKIESLLCIGTNDVRSVGIWGIGGIGKTTLAEAVFNKISSQFEGFCFTYHVRERSEQSGGLNQLRQELRLAIFGDGNMNVCTSIVGHDFTRNRLNLSKGLDSIFNELRYLHWYGCPFKWLQMQDSNVELLWNGQLVNLKEIDLSGSENLISCPNLSRARNLDILYLNGCTSLLEVPSSLQYLSKLDSLSLVDCKSLRGVPDCFAGLKSLKKFNMYGCLHVKMLPEMSCNIEYLNLSETAIEELSPAIDNRSKLVKLSLRRCLRLKSLPTSICKQKSLERLFLCHCSKIDKLPDEIGALESLITLDIAGTAIKEVPSSIVHLNNLEMLSFKRCKVQNRMMNLLLLPSLGLCSLKKLDLIDCGIAKIPNSLTHLSQLQRLYLGSNKFEIIPANIENLFNLEYLDISYCQKLQFLPKLPSVSINTVNSPPGWNNNKFVGFALCAVMENQHHRIVNSWDLYSCCECNLKSKDGHWHTFTGKFDHVYMGSDHLMYPRDTSELSYDVEVTFQFYIEIGLRRVKCCKVKNCGIRLMYSQDLGKSSASFSFGMERDPKDLHSPPLV
ncbi:hypothetical protein ACOSQ2_032276 [Xanthoceras sorbifolium]